MSVPPRRHEFELSGPVAGEFALPSDRAWTEAEMSAVDTLVTHARRSGVTLVVRDPCPDLELQLDAMSLHRRVVIVGRALPEMGEMYTTPEPVSLDPVQVAQQLETLPAEDARRLLVKVVAIEDERYARNRTRPYQDVLPPVLERVAPARTAQLLADSAPVYVTRVLLGDYTRVADTTVGSILEAFPRKVADAVLRVMLAGADHPCRLGPALAACGLTDLLSGLRPDHVLTLLETAPTVLVSAWVARSLSSPQRAELESRGLAVLLEEAAEGMRVRARRGRTSEREPLVATGTRVEREVEEGRWIHVEEVFEGPFGPKRSVADLLEIDPMKVRLEATRSFQRTPVADAAARFGDRAPTCEAFAELGLFQLSKRAADEGALGAINGNFYFDYGHLENAATLGIPVVSVPGVCFGDPVGWFVAKGEELSPPSLGRCAFVVARDGRPWIGRVKMCGLQVGDEVVYWSRENVVPSGGETVVFTSLWGTTSPATPSHVHLAVANGRVLGRVDGGEATIPMTGFLLALPKGDPRVEALPVGTPVAILNDCPVDDVETAVACGPLLVRDGDIAIDFAAEEFGPKDSPVMSFFLPRLIDAYEAARSFVAITKEGKVLLGVISGRSFGRGDLDQPAGMTFGELARFALDLDVEVAMGLDGGGSSSLVTSLDGELRVLNVPTGGSDVPRGEERFIANGILIHRREG
ncbi:MAG: phosphodiester glycosidase family protein [Myxococcota bacterium]